MSSDDIDAEELHKRLVQQNNARFTIRNNKLRVMSILYLIIFFSIAALQTISIAFFTRGFLLSRQVLENYSSLDDDIFQKVGDLKQFDKAVVIVIDALRFDFVIPDYESTTEVPYHNHLKLPYQLTQDSPLNSVLLKFVADPPTTTLQRLKGLTTGSLPTFVDAGSNFNGDVIDEDNFIKQLYTNNKKITFVGDDTWEAVFGPFLNDSYPYDSLNVWDLHTVDNGVIEHVIPFLQPGNQKNWDVLIGHLLGVDHVGHRYGPNHFTMKDKQEQMDKFLKNVIELIDDKTLLVVFGDHGMDRTGNHGGDSKDELEAALWLYSKKDSFRQLNSELYNISSNGENYRQVDQIDLVSTFSLLLGLPVPFNNLGAPIQEAFQTSEKYDLASLITLEQLQRYREHYSSLKDDEEINIRYQELKTQWNGNLKTEFTRNFHEYQLQSLERCKDLWTRFDLISISIGLSLFATSLIILIVYSKLIPSVVITQLSEEIVPAIVAMVSLSTVIFIAISLILKPAFLNLRWFALLGVSVGIIFGFFIPIFDRYSPAWLFSSFLDLFRGFWTLLALSFAAIHAIIFASNSFTIWEDRILSYLLTTFGFAAIFKSLQAAEKIDRVMGVYHSISFIVITRLASLITICREEQGDKCTSSFSSSWWTILLIFINSQFMPSIVKAFYDISGSYQSAAPLWNKGFKFILFLISIYWTLEQFEHKQSEIPLESLRSISLSSVHFFKITLARVVFGITLIASNIGWSRGPLCVKLNIRNSDSSNREASILGYQNVYGSQYFLLVINFTALILSFTKPLGQIAIFLLIYQILSLMELVRILDIRANLISPVVLGLLGAFYFFTTGHQATIPSINWELGFALTQSVVFPFSHIPIALNTFGSFIIVAISVSLITLWRITPSLKPVSLYSKVIENCGTLLAYQSFVTLSTLIFATVFRRHLMVWKIFAPRFMLAALSQLVTNFVLVFITIGFGTGKIIIQINRVFGK